jgi:sugar transport protein
MLAMAIIDCVGRKGLLLIGSLGTALCLAGVAAIFFSGKHESLLVWASDRIHRIFRVLSRGGHLGYISEVFPNRVRAKGQSLGSFSHWFANALISGLLPLMAEKSGGVPFVFFAVMMVVQFVVVLVVYPETKGVSLEQMQRNLAIS